MFFCLEHIPLLPHFVWVSVFSFVLDRSALPPGLLESNGFMKKESCGAQKLKTFYSPVTASPLWWSHSCCCGTVGRAAFLPAVADLCQQRVTAPSVNFVRCAVELLQGSNGGTSGLMRCAGTGHRGV